jgi:nucleotide-binding universal stress UspA family protein
MMLICYDGSPDAEAAVERAAEPLKGESSTVLTVWQPFVEVLAHTPSGFGLAPGAIDFEAIDQATRTNAEQRAEEGAELARQAGLDATARTCAQETTTARAILAEAAAVGARAIVMGSRGLTGLKSVLLGSVSHGVIQHPDRTVVVVPSPDVAAARRHQPSATGPAVR